MTYGQLALEINQMQEIRSQVRRGGYSFTNRKEALLQTKRGCRWSAWECQHCLTTNARRSVANWRLQINAQSGSHLLIRFNHTAQAPPKAVLVEFLPSFHIP